VSAPRDDPAFGARNHDRLADPHGCGTDTPGVLEVCEGVLVEHGALDRCVSIEPRRREDQHADLRLLFADRSWLQSQAGSELVSAFAQHPALASAKRHKAAIVLRFEDRVLATLEQLLAAGHVVGMKTAHLLDGDRFTVGIVGPNTNKALHVGHLRNIFVGQALASAMASAGAAVERHNLIGDIGRRVCEAMAGYMVNHPGESPQLAGLAGDRFVEICCRDFAAESSVVQTAPASEPNAEETESRGDVAEEIMRAWLRGAEPERALWRRMRAWALEGHERTLARLGLRMDRHDFESDGLRRALALIAEGVQSGLFEREPSGAVVYRTGRSEYTTMVLLRGDGAPTEYARLLGVYHQMYQDLPPAGVYVEVVGIEWQPAMSVLSELLTRLLRTSTDERFTWAFHGSVTVGGQKMGSSTGQVKWIDDLLEEVARGPTVATLHELAGDAATREQLADLLVRAAFLCSDTLEPFAFSYDRLLEDRSGPGWTIAEAWCRAQHARAPQTAVPVNRTALVQSQLYPRALQRAAAKRDAAGLASYLLSLAEACLAAPTPGPAAARILGTVLGALGFPLANRQVQVANEGGSVHAIQAGARRTETETAA